MIRHGSLPVLRRFHPQPPSLQSLSRVHLFLTTPHQPNTALRNLLRAEMSTRTPWTPNSYPATHRSDHVDTYESKAHGSVKIPDPYQWLEENSPETAGWVDAQASFTRQYLDQNRDKERFKAELTKNWDFARVRM